ncbi:MAG TPA: metallophosphoesterase, partial [Candidatus Elarobacter sp.]|nr:metallophosphoesterase [Candidatus Elarobacter sp.]
MPTTIVHAADVHLETAFTEVRGGARRRAALADAFVRIIDLALERRADVLTIGGDLYEAQRAGPQTARFIFTQLARFGGPVLVAPGNHDPYAAGALYARDDRPPNLRVFAEPAWSAFPVAPDVTIYGFGHAPAEPGRPFAGARFNRPGTRIALVHGSDEDRCPPGKRATAPFTVAEIVAAGADLALSGHYHGGTVVCDEDGRPRLAYPGSPEP